MLFVCLFVFVGKRVTVSKTLPLPNQLYFITGFKVFKNYFNDLNTILKPLLCILMLFCKKFQILVII